VKKLTDPNRKVNCQKCQKGASKSALLSWRNEHTTITVENRWDEFCMAHSATTMNENVVFWRYAVARRVVQRSSILLVRESPRMSLTRDALWHNGL
jgi:hypothetical protein